MLAVRAMDTVPPMASGGMPAPGAGTAVTSARGVTQVTLSRSPVCSRARSCWSDDAGIPDRDTTLRIQGTDRKGTPPCVQGAIARTADQVAGAMDGADLAIARTVFLRLTEPGRETPDTRRRAPLAELLGTGDPDAVRGVLERLVAARLVVADERTAEVAHEALIREWPQLREWLDEDRDALRTQRTVTDAAAEWDRATGDASLLFRGGRLAGATDWLTTHPADASDLERTFIDASRAEAEREAAEREAARQRELDAARRATEAAERAADAERARADDQARSARRLRRGATALVGLLVVALVLAGFSFVRTRRSRPDRAAATRSATTSAGSSRPAHPRGPGTRAGAGC